jgi:chemotaxis-related protein WspB
MAVPASAVVEVVPAVRLHPLVGAPPWVAGVFRYRGTVTPVLDLHRVATGEACPIRLSSRVVIVHDVTGAEPRPLGQLAERIADLKPQAVSGPAFSPGLPAGGPELGPLVADSEGVVRLPDLTRLVPAAVRGALSGGAGP